MTRHQQLTDDLRDQASLFALGLLEGEEATRFEAHLDACPVCAGEVRDCSEVVVHMAMSLPQSNPAPHVREAVLRQALPQSSVIRAEEGAWIKTLPGIEVKRLFIDPVTHYVTSLVKVAAGAVYPPHLHAGMEQLYVVDGDAIFDDHTLNTGDYEASPPDTKHSAVRTETGCLLLVINNTGDQIL